MVKERVTGDAAQSNPSGNHVGLFFITKADLPTLVLSPWLPDPAPDGVWMPFFFTSAPKAERYRKQFCSDEGYVVVSLTLRDYFRLVLECYEADVRLLAADPSVEPGSNRLTTSGVFIEPILLEVLAAVKAKAWEVEGDPEHGEMVTSQGELHVDLATDNLAAPPPEGRSSDGRTGKAKKKKRA
jgi:hypothetical protein